MINNTQPNNIIVMFAQQINAAIIIIIIIVKCTLGSFSSPFLRVLGTKTTKLNVYRYNNIVIYIV